MRRVLLALALLAAARPALAQRTIAQATEGMEKRDGYFPLYWDATKGHLLLELPQLDQDFLYLTSLATGVGALDLGLDRGTIGATRIGRFERVGPKVLFVLQNPEFTAYTSNPALKRAARESFPTSTVAAFDVIAEDHGRLLVDITPFALSDVMDVAGALKRGNQGSFKLDGDRSTLYLDHTKAFPKNTEIEAALTFTSDAPGRAVRRHAPDARSITVREHHSFVELPDSGYHPRAFDTRMGLFNVTVWDFARGFDQDYRVRYVMRHRLIKRDPTAAMSEPVRPIVYYLDPAVPEPYRTAFKEGAGWWNTVLEAAGFINAFRVEDMPPGMDPMDARYNVIQWVERTTPGYSIGPSFVDPRTGEIIKAAVRMDTYRSQSDFDLYAGTIPATGLDDATADGEWLATLDPNVSAVDFAMARRRQHAAHEVGHTLGLAHNFTAASYGRASVMDYPAPYITLANGTLDLSKAYRNGPGAWDSIAIRYAYTEFADSAAEARGLAAIAQEAMRRGFTFITNPDEAPSGSYPLASTWVNGSDMNDELARVMDVRRFLISKFDARAIRPGEPMALLVKRFTPVYLWDRFTLLAAIKAVGGMEFRYGLRGDTIPVTRVLSPERQRRALSLVLDALDPSELAVPERVIALMAPTPFGYGEDERALHSDAGPAFDQIAVARTFANEIVTDLLDPERLARVAAFNARDPREPGLEEVLGDMVDRAFAAPVQGPDAAIQRVVQRVAVDGLLGVARNPRAAIEARAAAEWALNNVLTTIEQRAPLNAADAAHLHLIDADIQRFLNRTDAPTPPTPPVEEPPSDPIGGD